MQILTLLPQHTPKYFIFSPGSWLVGRLVSKPNHILTGMCQVMWWRSSMPGLKGRQCGYGQSPEAGWRGARPSAPVCQSPVLQAVAVSLLSSTLSLSLLFIFVLVTWFKTPPPLTDREFLPGPLKIKVGTAGSSSGRPAWWQMNCLSCKVLVQALTCMPETAFCGSSFWYWLVFTYTSWRDGSTQERQSVEFHSKHTSSVCKLDFHTFAYLG